MNCSYCGRRMPGRLYMTGERTCQGCGAQLPEPPKEYDMTGVIEKSVTYTYYEQKDKKEQ